MYLPHVLLVMYRTLHSASTDDWLSIFRPVLSTLADTIGHGRTHALKEWSQTANISMLHPEQLAPYVGELPEEISSAIAATLLALRWEQASDRDPFETILRWGGDTAMAAALAGGLLGGRFGLSAMPDVPLVDESVIQRVSRALDSQDGDWS